MNKKQYERFAALVELVPPKPRNLSTLEEACRVWFNLHPFLKDLQANEASLNTIRECMWVELNREEGPRAHMMDRLYKRFSNLRREMETGAMNVLLPVPVPVDYAEDA